VFAGFYEQYLPKVYRYISYRISDTPTAEDLTSIVFEKALTKFDSFCPEKAQFSTWIFTIARNTLIDHFRTDVKSRTVSFDPSFQYQTGPSLEEESERAEDIHLLKSCLARLSPL
jgi:RNA polymerase sigma-70 factor (ECF subfamily)